MGGGRGEMWLGNVLIWVWWFKWVWGHWRLRFVSLAFARIKNSAPKEPHKVLSCVARACQQRSINICVSLCAKLLYVAWMEWVHSIWRTPSHIVPGGGGYHTHPLPATFRPPSPPHHEPHMERHPAPVTQPERRWSQPASYLVSSWPHSGAPPRRNPTHFLCRSFRLLWEGRGCGTAPSPLEIEGRGRRNRLSLLVSVAGA